ncbi:MAG: CRTAC1 family protein [Pyrinomonadaceae bacterium]
MKKLIVIALVASFGFACGSKPGTTNTSPASSVSFVDATKTAGIDFKHQAGLSSDKWMPEVLAGGVAVADFNNDGFPDIYFANSGIYGKERPENAPDALFINDGKARFANKSKEWNVGGNGYGQGVAVGDFDGDGNTDLFLTNLEGDNRLLKNTGSGFEDVTEQSGIQKSGKWATSAGFGDFDNDGDLDLFVVNYVEYSRDLHTATYRNGMQTYSTPLLYEGVGDQILLNDGTGKFTDATEKSGISKIKEKGLALAIGDIDLDGDVDVYVANDSTPNSLWINDGSGVFEDRARIAGCSYSEVGKEEGSMGADFSDIDSNGLFDITVTNFQDESTALYSQTKPYIFREVSDAVGIGQTSRMRLSFGIEFFDADNDGDEDILMANGHIDDTLARDKFSSIEFAQQNTLFENDGKGKFKDISDSAGPALSVKSVSRGIAVADFDNDGDLDFVVSNNDSTPQLAINESKTGNSFAGFTLVGKKANRNAIGARIIAKIGEKTVTRLIMGAQSYQSVSDFRQIIGLGNGKKIDQLDIIWPGGEKETFKDVAGGKWYKIEQGGGGPV